MGTPLDTKALRSLPPGQRVERYRQLANEAFRRAYEARNKSIRAEFLALAANWHAMAEELDSVPSASEPD
jgi:hypothetical protein